jgi:hypothetical protein
MLDILSPEALMARQLASQRTAAAIPGPGPVQTDLAPNLEYSAPRALFLHEFCQMMQRYDERTVQQLLAPPEKQAQLRALSKDDVQLVFRSFATVNAQLFHSVMGDPAGANVPSVFQTSKSIPPPSSTASVYDMATRAFSAGNVLEAKQLISQWLQMYPNDTQAAYLARAFERASATPQTSKTSGVVSQ